MDNRLYLAETKPENFDDRIDAEIQECLDMGSGKSFVTFAGAGSGKTRSLKEALNYLKEKYSAEFVRQNKQIAVVTFTKNAAEEIQDRVEQSPIFTISTIHSFCWSAIKGFNEDIRKWYLEKIPTDLEELAIQEKKGRPGKASDNRQKEIARLSYKLLWLKESRKFIYDPNGVNSSLDSLSHDDVLKIFSHFMNTKPMMREIIINKFPFVFIDECQDANKDVINAFFQLKDRESNKIVFGLFGDSMQRIFGGGEAELGKSKPKGWTSFNKEMNHRSARRIVDLGNRIRSEDDGRVQYANDDAIEGYVRYFLLQNDVEEKNHVESKIRERMKEITNDAGWMDIKSRETAILFLEHRMAGKRLGIDELWDKLSLSNKIKDQISKEENSELNFFSKIVFPLAQASRNQIRGELMSILREYKSPLLKASLLEENKENPLDHARKAEQSFREVVLNDKVSFRKVLEVIAESNLLIIPEKLQIFLPDSKFSHSDPLLNITSDMQKIEEMPEVQDSSEISAWENALETNFFQIQGYKNYFDENSIYRTHQGIKGNEFERVMVIMDDNEARGFLFSYEQYFGVKSVSQGSNSKSRIGEETSLDRTRRLFYVTSTRAKSSLAHVIYTSDVEKVRDCLLEKKFALWDEISVWNRESSAWISKS